MTGIYNSGGAVAQVKADLLSPEDGKGSKMVAFKQRLATSIARRVEDKLAESVSVLDFYDAEVDLDYGAAFTKAAAAAMTIRVPYGPGIYNVGTAVVAIRDGQTWLMEGPTLTHTDPTKTIFRANNVNRWAILGRCAVQGLRVAPAVDLEAAIWITGCKRYLVQGVQANNFRGQGFRLDGANPSGLRGDRGQFSDCSANDCTTGRLIEALAEYAVWTNWNGTGCLIADDIAAGNTLTLGGNVVDNTRGVVLRAGGNHGHGAHIGVNINHNTVYNIEAVSVLLGYDFIGCHLYGDAAGAGAIFLNGCKGINIDGGHLDCWIYAYGGAGYGQCFIRNMYCPGTYGDIKRLDVGSVMPDKLVVLGCYGPGAYDLGVSINDPAPVYVHARRPATANQALVTGVPATLIFPDVQAGGDRKKAYNAATGVATIPAEQAGQYRVALNVAFSGVALSAGTVSYCELRFVSGGTTFLRFVPLVLFSTTLLTGSLTTDFYLNAGDTVQAVGTIAGTTVQFGSAAYQSALSLERIA